jgi:hypothetical protein
MEELLDARFPRRPAETAAVPAEKSENAVLWPESTIPCRFARCLPPENVSPENDPALPRNFARAFTLLQKQGASLERIASALEILADKAAALPQLPPEWEELRAEVRDLRLLLASAEKTQQQDMDQLRAWIMRLARK